MSEGRLESEKERVGRQVRIRREWFTGKWQKAVVMEDIQPSFTSEAVVRLRGKHRT